MEEGLKIAERVDTLRETLQNEEQASKVYLQGVLKGIQEDIIAKRLENEKLDTDIQRKREEWNQLMQPIDKNWLWFVKSEKAKMEAQETGNIKIDQQLQLAISANIQRERINEETSKKLDSERSAYANLIRSAKEEVKKSKNIIAQSRKDAQKMMDEAQLREQRAIEREMKVTEYENHLDLRKKELDKQESDIQTREFKVLAKELEFYSPIKKL